MHKFLFTGPTLSYSDILNSGAVTPIKKLASVESALEYSHHPEDCIIVLPPVAGGDLYKIHTHKHPFLIAIIDGYFENRISVWHKEILYLLSMNIPVLGSSSMGALRAAEMKPFGMIGVGNVYKNFASGLYEDDDEVTVSHGPAEAGFPQISEAMTNIRCTIDAAVRNNILIEAVAEDFIRVAKSTFYKKRNYGYIIRQCIEYDNMREGDFARFVIWLEKYRVNQKRLDALSLIEIIDNFELKAHSRTANFVFEDTVMWRNAIKT